MESLCEECHLSPLVCGLGFGHCTENGHNHHHSLCDSLLSHSILVCALYLGPGRDRIYPDCDFDVADITM